MSVCVCACVPIDSPRLLSAAASIFGYCSDSAERIIFATLAILDLLHLPVHHLLWYGLHTIQCFLVSW